MAHFASRASERLTRFLSFGRKAHQSPGCPSANPGSSAIASPRNDLPIELLLPIFQQLSLADTLSCRLACRWFQRVIDDTPEMRYHIELYVAARKDNNLNNMMGTGARFEALVSHEKSWKPPHGSWSRTSFEWEHGNKLYHQYYDNVWVRSLREGDLDRTKWSHWNAVQCVCFERAEDGSAIVDTWRLSFPFVFESFVVEPSRGILYLCNSRPIHEKTGYRLWRVSILDGSILSDTLFETDGWRIDERWLSQSMSCQGDVIAVMTLFTSVKMENHMVGTRMALLDCRSEDVVAVS
ncbi:hypothetical protein BDW22DRAFT_180175 [Trametopsis cervina]|nr:hypothetical protein BDW22DRAFT_180175 [Trametopsis cervina]